MHETGMAAKIKVFLVDDHPLVRESLTSLINRQSDLIVCGEAEEPGRALRDIAAVQPDVVIVDISLKNGSGLELVKSIKARMPRLYIIVLSMHDERLYAERAIRAGARGYVMKRESTKRIVAAIHQVMQGRLCVSEQIAATFAERFVGGHQVLGESPVEGLSDRELEVFTMLGRGLETRQVAEALNISIKTVQAYCARIKQKLSIASATELLREAIRWQEKQPSN
jgi:DNA-binding NarL/FixJ family response regulator